VYAYISYIRYSPRSSINRHTPQTQTLVSASPTRREFLVVSTPHHSSSCPVSWASCLSSQQRRLSPKYKRVAARRLEEFDVVVLSSLRDATVLVDDSLPRVADSAHYVLRDPGGKDVCGRDCIVPSILVVVLDCGRVRRRIREDWTKGRCRCLVDMPWRGTIDVAGRSTLRGSGR
jgi:hypothetical protein